MSKAVLMSIQPKWVEKIASGEKTIEVRKTKPKLETPFKVYIYCTKYGLVIYGNGKQYVTDSCEFLKGSAVEAFENSSGFYKWNGKVIGEFICDRIAGEGETIRGNACLTVEELQDYCNGKDLYFWRISDLKIYDKPKELSEFKRWNRTEDNAPCAHTKWLYPDCKDCTACNLKRPPQSWCYVED